MNRPTILPARCGHQHTVIRTTYTCVAKPHGDDGKHMYVQLDDTGQPARVIH